MLEFKIFEIPDGRSKRSVQLEADAFNLGRVSFKGGLVDIEFYKTTGLIQTRLHLAATVELVCDRSLEEFDFKITRDYEVLFKAEQVEESGNEHSAVRSYDLKLQQIDLEQDVRDTILLEVPIKKIHPRFLDENGNPAEFQTRTFGKPDDDYAETDEIDPRWEALKELKK